MLFRSRGGLDIQASGAGNPAGASYLDRPWRRPWAGWLLHPAAMTAGTWMTGEEGLRLAAPHPALTPAKATTYVGVYHKEEIGNLFET